MLAKKLTFLVPSCPSSPSSRHSPASFAWVVGGECVGVIVFARSPAVAFGVNRRRSWRSFELEDVAVVVRNRRRVGSDGGEVHRQRRGLEGGGGRRRRPAMDLVAN